MTRAQVSVIVRNVLQAKRRLPDVPLFLENIAWTFRWPEDEMSEGQFYSEIVERTGCPLLLDVGNLFGNAVNSGTDPSALLQQYPLERVAMVHIAGGVFEHGFYFDTHAHPVLPDVYALLRTLMERAGDLPIVLERDADFPTHAELEHELARARETHVGRPCADVRPRECEAGAAEGPGELLGRAQARLAEPLTSAEPPTTEDCAPFDPHGIARARDVLVRKRVDDALPLLVHLHARAQVVRPLAYALVATLPRPRSRVAAHDAMHLASRFAGDAALGWDARRDELVLRAKYHFSPPGAVPRPRVGPFCGSVSSPSGARMWVLKRWGRAALVRHRLVPR